MLNLSRGRRKLYRAWLKQDRLCPGCQKPITRNTPWKIRYIMKKADGGTNAESNILTHHLYCQRSYHNVEKFSGEIRRRKVAFVEA